MPLNRKAKNHMEVIEQDVNDIYEKWLAEWKVVIFED